MHTWATSNAGKWFGWFMRELVSSDKKEIDLWIYKNTDINPTVIKKWREGGNPSIVNLEKIGSKLPFSDQGQCTKIVYINNVIEGTRHFKKISVSKNDDRVKLSAVISYFDRNKKVYHVDVYDGDKKITRERLTKYSYIPVGINSSMSVRKDVLKYLGHSNYEIIVNPQLSIKEVK